MHGWPTREEMLAATGKLHELEFGCCAVPRRKVWAASEFVSELDAMHSWPWDRDEFEPPRAQAKAILRQYVEGERRLVMDWDYKLLRNGSEPVYELRTRDVRIFGALVERGQFCTVRALPKSELRSRDSYQPHIDYVRSFVRSLAIPPPRFHQSRIDDVME